MKYLVVAKFIGSYLPEKRSKIANCVIFKSYDQYHIDDDRPAIPIRSKDSEFHILKQGVKNYIFYPQELISVRTFESEYLITTEVDTYGEYDAVKIAGERFSDIASVLSLVAKNKVVVVNRRRLKKDDEAYDFEIVGIFLKTNKSSIRLKLPKPLTNGRNFFPTKMPKGFLSQAKKYINFRDAVFQKGLIYFQRATAMRHSGVFSDVEVVLNFIKCIELICFHVAKENNRFGYTRKQFEELGVKKVIELAGKNIKASKKSIKGAKNLWVARNRGDIAHQDLYFNPYSRRSANALINYRDIESDTAEFLRKYFKYKNAAP